MSISVSPTQETAFFQQISQHKGSILAFVLTILWAGVCIDYVFVSEWWYTRSTLSLVEFIGACSGFFLPVVLFWLTGSFIDRSVLFHKETAAIQSYLNELIYPTPDGPDYTEGLIQALKKQIIEFKSVFESVTEQTTLVREDLKQWVSDLNTVITHVDTQTITSIKAIAEHIHNLTDITETANEQTQQVSEMFSEQAVILQRVTKQTSETMTQLVETLAHHIQAAGNSKTEITVATEQSAQVVEQLENNARLLSVQSAEIEKIIGTYEETAKHQNARLFGNLEKILSVFKAHGTLLEDEVSKTAEKLSLLEFGLQQKAENTLQLTQNSIRQMNDAGGLFLKQSQLIQDKTDLTRRQLEGLSKQIEQNVTLVDKKVLKVLSKKTTEDCLKEASVISAGLQQASIDMAGLFPKKIQESLWEKYYAGDKSVFMRHISETISDRQMKKVVAYYHQNDAFKGAVLKYREEFEKMTKIAGQNQESNLLVSVLIGSDMGRLYMVLIDMLKKADEYAH